jgi:hypothetical protein
MGLRSMLARFFERSFSHDNVSNHNIFPRFCVPECDGECNIVADFRMLEIRGNVSVHVDIGSISGVDICTLHSRRQYLLQ